MSEAPKPLDAALDLFVYVPVGLALTAAEELPKLAAKGRTRVNSQLAMARVVGQFAVTRGRQFVEARLANPVPAPDPATPAGQPGPARSHPAGPRSGGAPASTFEEMTGQGSGADRRPAASTGRSGLAGITPIAAARTGGGPAETGDRVGVGTGGSGQGSERKSAGGEALPGADHVEGDQAITVSTVGDLDQAGRADGAGTGQGGDAGPAVTVPDRGSLAIPGYDSLSASQVVQRLAGLNQEELTAVGAYEQAHRGRRTVLNRVDQLRGA